MLSLTGGGDEGRCGEGGVICRVFDFSEEQFVQNTICTLVPRMWVKSQQIPTP